ncbi:MAG: dTDP-4-dehydrorhamnose reductase [Desulfurivibrionaceae bacterium]
MATILLTGKNGQVGWELQRSLQPLGKVLAPDRSELDLNDRESIRRTVRETRPDIIVNAAAYTAVDQAEEDEEAALRINSRAPALLAAEAASCGSLLIHYSTDYVFDGDKEGPYCENDHPAPLNVYGSSKLAGEEGIREAGADHLILRTSWVYSLRGKNFLLTMLRLFREREKIAVIADQTGTPTWARLIAETTALVLHQAGGERERGDFSSGTFHLTGRGWTTWYGFAGQIKEEARLIWGEDRMKINRIQAIAAKDYPTAAVRPRNSRLDISALEKRFGLQMPDWASSLKICLEQLTDQTSKKGRNLIRE